MNVTLIAAVSNENCIGKDGTLPWHIADELAHFYHTIAGKPVIMGRKTWESIPKGHRPLRGCTSIVITRQSHYEVPPGVLVYASIEDALVAHNRAPEIMIAGGEEIYRQTIGLAHQILLSRVGITVENGDAFFPPIDAAVWSAQPPLQREGFDIIAYERHS